MATIVVAGGLGARMGTNIPKQFIDIGGKPILMRTVWALHNLIESVNEKLQQSGSLGLGLDFEQATFIKKNAEKVRDKFSNRRKYVNRIVNNFIIVLPKEYFLLWKGLCIDNNFKVRYTIAEGGGTRFESVKNGMALAENADIVIIHDGVRPFVSSSVFEKTLVGAYNFGAAIPVVPLVDSLRKVVDNLSETVDRAEYRAVQTPQIFHKEILFDSYKQAYKSTFTDDATVVEDAGYAIFLTDGDVDNIKITTERDLIISEYLLKQPGYTQDF